MARLPPREPEDVYIIAVMAVIAREIRYHLHNIRRRKTSEAGNVRVMIERLEAAGKGGIEPVPDYTELNTQSIAATASAATMPDGAAAAPPQPTAAPLIQSPSFSPSFLSPVKQNGGLADCATICGVSLDWFTRNVDQLMANLLFPLALPEPGQRRWVLARVREWAANPIATTPLARARAAHAKTLEKTQ